MREHGGKRERPGGWVEKKKRARETATDLLFSGAPRFGARAHARTQALCARSPTRHSNTHGWWPMRAAVSTIGPAARRRPGPTHGRPSSTSRSPPHPLPQRAAPAVAPPRVSASRPTHAVPPSPGVEEGTSGSEGSAGTDAAEERGPGPTPPPLPPALLHAAAGAGSAAGVWDVLVGAGEREMETEKARKARGEGARKLFLTLSSIINHPTPTHTPGQAPPRPQKPRAPPSSPPPSRPAT